MSWVNQMEPRRTLFLRTATSMAITGLMRFLLSCAYTQPFDWQPEHQNTILVQLFGRKLIKAVLIPVLFTIRKERSKAVAQSN